MKGNIFSKLVRHDEDEEEHRPNKKEVRAIDKNLRETHGDKVVKNEFAKESAAPKKYVPGEQREGKRDYDRHSGTVKQAFGNPRPRGGKRPDDRDLRKETKEGEQEADAQPVEEEEDAAPQEPEIEPISLEDYLKEKNLVDENNEEAKLNVNPTQINIPGVKLAPAKVRGAEGVIKRNNDIKNLSKPSENTLVGAERAPQTFDRPDRADRPDRPERTERGGPRRGGDRPDRGAPRRGGDRRDHGERGDRADRGEPRRGRGGAPRRDREDREDQEERPEKEQEPAQEGETEQAERPKRGRGGRGGDRGGDRADRGDRDQQDRRPQGSRGSGTRGGQSHRGGARPQRPAEPTFTSDDFPTL